jgi:hypothetical protein
MTLTALARPRLRLAMLDATILTAVALMPAAAHALRWPLYLFEPMRVGLFAALALSGRRNALALAVAMPLLAFLTGGHPAPPKLYLLTAELALNAWLLGALLASSPLRRPGARRWAFAAAAAGSVVLAKGFYYSLKFALLKAGALDGALVTTPWRCQLAVLALVAVTGQLAWAARWRPDARP